MVVSPRSPLEVFLTRDANAAPNRRSCGAATIQRLRTDAGVDMAGRCRCRAVGQQFAETCSSPSPARARARRCSMDRNVLRGQHRRGVGRDRSIRSRRRTGTSSNDGQVHVDLHGLFLSPDFHAGFDDGRYVATAGTVWLLSDGGIDRSTDGGITFHPAGASVRCPR